MKKIKVLIVEDQRITSLSLKENLESLNYEVTDVVDRAENVCKSIDANVPDIILMDIILKGKMTGIEAAEIVMNSYHIPIIYLTASSDDRTLRKAKITHPYGYVIKPFNLEKLKVSIEIGLHVHETNEKLRVSEQRLKAAQEIGKIGCWELNLIKDELYWSEQVYHMFELDSGQFSPSYDLFLEMIHPDDVEYVDQAFNNTLHKKIPYDIEHRIVLKDGRIKYVREKCTIEYNSQDKPVVAMGTVQDITEVKKIENALDNVKVEHSRLLDRVNDAIVTTDEEGRFINFNKEATRLFEYDAETLKTKGIPDLVLEEDADKYIEFKQNLLTEGFNHSEERLITGKGNVRYVKISSTAYYKNGKFAGTNDVLRDVTERKLYETRLKDNQINWNSLVNNANEIIVIIDNDLNITFVNKLSDELVIKGYSIEDVYGKSFKYFVREEEHPKALMAVAEVRATRSSTHLIISSAVSNNIYDCRVTPLIKNNEIVGFITLMTDITIKMRAEEALAEREEHFRMLVENSSDAVTLINLEGKILWGTDNVKQLFGYEPAELRGKNISEVIHKGDINHVLKVLEQIAEKPDKPYIVEYRVLMKNGSYKMFESAGRLVAKSESEKYIVINSRNISLRKLAEEKIIKSERKYRNIFESINDIFFRTNLDGKCLLISPSVFEIVDYHDREIQGKNLSLITGEKDWKRLKEQIAKRGKVLGFEIKTYTKKGDPKYLSINARMVFNNKHKPAFIEGTARDITDKKISQFALKQNEEHYRNLFERNLSGIYHCSLDNTIIECNDAFAQIIGFNNKNEVIGKKVPDLYQNISDTDFVEMVRDNDGVILGYESLLRKNDGNEVWTLENASIVNGQDGQSQYIEGSVIDITKIKTAEKEKEIIERLPLENPNPILRAKYDLSVIFANEPGKELRKLISSESDIDEDQIVSVCKEMIATGQSKRQIEFAAHGRTFLLAFSNMPAHQYINLYATDITELKKVQADYLQLSLDLERVVNERTKELNDTVSSLYKEARERKKVEEEIKASLNEKEILLNEITHRVKNNLQVISSLMSLQLDELNSVEAIKIMEDTTHRIKSMSLIHETLYKNKDFNHIDFQEYVQALASYITNSFITTNISLKVEVEQKISISIDTATSCGMIMMELVTNSFKYAFPDNMEGSIIIRVEDLKENLFRIEIGDDGVGITDDKIIRNKNSLGMQIVYGMVNQLSGTIELETNKGKGTKYTITIKDKTRQSYV